MTLKRQWLALFGIVLLTAQCAQETAELKTEKDKVNYGIGVSIGKSFKQQGMEVDIDLVMKGLKDELTGKKLLLSDDDLRKTMTAYQHELREKQMQALKVVAMENKKAGENFQAPNKKKEGVVTLPQRSAIPDSQSRGRPEAHNHRYRGGSLSGDPSQR